MRIVLMTLMCLVTLAIGTSMLPSRVSAAPARFQPELVSVELAASEVRPGDPISFTLKFRNTGTQPASADYRVFTHFEAPRKSCENIVVHADHEPTEPTTLWKTDELIVDGPHTFSVPKDAAEGDYHIHVGLFDFTGSGERVLDVYCDTMVHVSRSAPPIDTLSPPPLARDEVEKRRAALVERIAPQDREGLETAGWRFDVDRNSGAWSLLDRSTNVLWTSQTTQSRFGRLVLQNGDRRVIWRIDRFDDVISMPGSLRLVARPQVDNQPTGITVLVTVVALPNLNGLQLAYTAQAAGPWQVASANLLEEAFEVTEEDHGRIYVPYRLGLELSADRDLPGNREFTTYDSLSMAMCGAVKQQSALLVSWFNVDSRLTVHNSWPDLPLVPGRRARSVSLQLSGPSNGCVIQLLGEGSYVDIAKAYRSMAHRAGWRRTWAEKRKQFPTVDRIFGAANFKPFVFSRVLPSSVYSRDGKEHTSLGFTFEEAAACAEHWRKDLEIDKAFVVLAGWINRGYDVSHPDVLPAAPECGGNEALTQTSARIRDCGYLFGLHDNYQDMYEDAPSFDHQWLNKDAQGVSRKGGNWNGGQAWQVCAIKQVELAARKETNLPAIARLFEPTIYFIDTVFAWPLVTCEDPAHPMTRHDDLIWKSNLCMLAKQHFGLFGSEEGREWAVPCADYLEGIFSHQTDSTPGEVIPLFPLVYSDCVQMMTHQGNRIGVGDEKKVADHILYAEMFLPSFGAHLYWKDAPITQSVPEDNVADTPVGIWSRGDGGWGEQLGQTDRVIKNVWEVLSPLNSITAELPLDDHRFLTEDRSVQQTRFGDVTITVAYQNRAELGDHVVPPYGFIVESPQFVAFCALRYNGVDYATPALFTARSLDGKPLSESQQVRIFHGFGDPHLKLHGKDFEVARESIVSLK